MRYGKEVKRDTEVLIKDLYRVGFDGLLANKEQLLYMVKLAKSHHKLAEAECNGELTARQRARQANIEKVIANIAAQFNLKVTFDGDPRGYTVKLHTEGNKLHNT